MTILSSLLVIACSGGPHGPEAPRALSMQVVPVGVEITTGETFQFKASIVDGRGNGVSGPITWTASGGTIDQNGMFVSGERPGRYSVIAQSQNGGTGLGAVASVVVVPPRTGTAGAGGRVVKVSPQEISLTPGATVPLKAKVQNKNGKNIKANVSWETTTGSISQSGTLTAGSQLGEFEVTARAGKDHGKARIKIVAPDGGSPPDTGTSDPPPDDPPSDPPPADDPPSDPPPPDDPQPTAILIEPEQAQLLSGDVLRFSATVVDENGDPVSASITWSATGGAIDITGLYAAGPLSGQYAVTATSGSLSATAPVTISPPPTSPSGTEIFPGESIQSAVDAHPSGTAFVLKSGVHRRQSVRPKDGNAFIGEAGAVMDGEGVTEFAFHPTANDVRISGLVVRNYDNAAQRGAIHAGGHDRPETTGWVVEDSEIAYNAGAGLRLSNQMRVVGNHIHHNGQIGIVGQGDGSLVENNEISYNNTAGFNPGWEAGGTKFVQSDGLVVRGNHVHHNDGPGLWTDINNINVLYEDNLVEHNTSTGIFHEISYRATIRNNTVRNNGHERGVWLYGAGILVAHSSDVEVYGNLVVDNFVGIAGIDQLRSNPSAEAHGKWTLKNLWVHDNVVRQPNAYRVAGISREDRVYDGYNLRFDRNEYTISSSSSWDNLNQRLSTSEWRASGQDANSTF